MNQDGRETFAYMGTVEENDAEDSPGVEINDHLNQDSDWKDPPEEAKESAMLKSVEDTNDYFTPE